MRNLYYYIYKCFYYGIGKIRAYTDKILTLHHLYGGRADFSSFSTHGVPYIMVARGAKGLTIGKNFKMNNKYYGNPIGFNEKCIFFVDKNSEIIIGENVGISSCALVSHCSIRIGNNVKINSPLKIQHIG